MSNDLKLFDNTYESFQRWNVVGPGDFAFHEGSITASSKSNQFGLLYYPHATYGDFVLELEFSLANPLIDNSGVFVRFRDPQLTPTASIRTRDRFHDLAVNSPWIAAYSGFEIQIDEQARGNRRQEQPDGMDRHRTGAVYNVPTGESEGSDSQSFTPAKPLSAKTWNRFAIEVFDDTYTVYLNGERTSRFHNSDTERAVHPRRDSTYGYIALQGYQDSCVKFRSICLKQL